MIKWTDISSLKAYQDAGNVARTRIRQKFFDDFIKTRPDFPQDKGLSSDVEHLFVWSGAEKENLPKLPKGTQKDSKVRTKFQQLHVETSDAIDDLAKKSYGFQMSTIKQDIENMPPEKRQEFYAKHGTADMNVIMKRADEGVKQVGAYGLGGLKGGTFGAAPTQVTDTYKSLSQEHPTAMAIGEASGSLISTLALVYGLGPTTAKVAPAVEKAIPMFAQLYPRLARIMGTVAQSFVLGTEVGAVRELGKAIGEGERPNYGKWAKESLWTGLEFAPWGVASGTNIGGKLGEKSIVSSLKRGGVAGTAVALGSAGVDLVRKGEITKEDITGIAVNSVTAALMHGYNAKWIAQARIKSQNQEFLYKQMYTRAYAPAHAKFLKQGLPASEVKLKAHEEATIAASFGLKGIQKAPPAIFRQMEEAVNPIKEQAEALGVKPVKAPVTKAPVVSSKVEVTPKAPVTEVDKLVVKQQDIKRKKKAHSVKKAKDLIKETTTSQAPVEVAPPGEVPEQKMHSGAHAPLKSGVRVEAGAPYLAEDRASTKTFQVQIQTERGTYYTVMPEGELVAMKTEIAKAPVTQKLPRYHGDQVIKVLGESPVVQMHLGIGLEPVARLYEYLDKMVDPVRNSPAEVARSLRGRTISQNVLTHHVDEARKKMQELVPDQESQELITKFIEPGGEEKYGDQMTPNMRVVAQLIMDFQTRIGKLAKKYGVIRQVLENYMKHLIIDPDVSPEVMDSKIRWAISANKISKFVESKMPRLRTESGEIIFPTIDALEAAGYKVATKNALDLFEYTVRSEGLAVINAELADKLSKIPYVPKGEEVNTGRYGVRAEYFKAKDKVTSISKKIGITTQSMKKNLNRDLTNVSADQSDQHLELIDEQEARLKSLTEAKVVLDKRLSQVTNKAKALGATADELRSRPLFQVMSFNNQNRAPADFRILRRGVFTQRWASPEAYNAVSSVAEPPLGGKVWRTATRTSKRIKFLFPFLHGWNLQRNAIETAGIPGSMKLVAEGAKQLKDPKRVQQMLEMGVNLFRINRLSGSVTDEHAKSLGRFDAPARLSEFLFTGLGDSVAAGMVALLEKQTAKAGLTGIEAEEVISEITNTLSGNLSPETMSRMTRELGRTMLLARNWTLSNIREGVGALGFLPKYWSPEQKKFVAHWYRMALLRGFLHLLAAANIINYLTTKHAYGTGRFTWQNEGRPDFKVLPVIWVDKKTGREFFATGWYGSLGDIVHWLQRAPTTAEHKLNVLVREIGQQGFNRDAFTGEKIWRDSDNFVEGVKHRVEHASKAFFTPAGIRLDVGKHTTPWGVRIMNVFGIIAASGVQDSDLLKRMYNFKEKKRYKIRDIDRKLYKAFAAGDLDKAEDIVKETDRFKSAEGLNNLYDKFQNPVYSFYETMSRDDQDDFYETLSPSDRARLDKAIRRFPNAGVSGNK